jgi:hypothetical protein
MLRLPVSEITVTLRPFTGAEDMLLLEAGDNELELAVSLLNRLASRCDAGDDAVCVDVASLPLMDVEALLLEMRRMLLGDVLLARAQCPATDCGARTDITFRLSEYLEHNRPRTPRRWPTKKESGWYGLPGADVEFRLVTAGDLIAAMKAPNPKSALIRRTIRPEGASARDIRRVQRIMDSLCPSLSQEVQGNCPECGQVVRLFFNVRAYVQRELGFEAAMLYQDVHVLATRYHWSEEKILALPRARRLHYAELVLAAGGAN